MQWIDKKTRISLKIANLMNDYFCSVFLTRWNSALYAHDNPSILLIVLHVKVVQVETSRASASTTCLTYDNLPTIVLSNCSNIIAPLVVQLFVIVLNAQKWPTLLKCAYITPILKTNNPEKVENYRPISILPQ